MENGYKKPFQDLLRRHRRYTTYNDTVLISRAFDFSFDAHKDQLRKSGPAAQHLAERQKLLHVDLWMRCTGRDRRRPLAAILAEGSSQHRPGEADLLCDGLCIGR